MNPSTEPMSFESGESFARACDLRDSLARFRERFHIPRRPDGRDAIYFAGNSLGLQPKTTHALLEEHLSDWASLGVDGHFQGKHPWYAYHEVFRDSLARLVGAKPDEVVAMNTLTVNLHLMMTSFYRPTAKRHAVVMEHPAFPSDTYAVRTQIQHHGLDPDKSLIRLESKPGETTHRDEALEELLQEKGDRVALVLLGGVNYYTGQAYDLKRAAAAAKQAGCVMGLDLAHAAGNVELALHDWGVDFAVWCHYKYLNGGPGAVAGCFVHERHGDRADLPRFGGWWGNDPATRFQMHLIPEFLPRRGADGWQVSNPPIFSLAPVRTSLDLFDEATMPGLRRKSMQLTGYLDFLLGRLGGAVSVITPREPHRRGCQLSLTVADRPRDLLAALHGEGVVCDFREPDVIRVAPIPLYNTFLDVWRFGEVLARHVGTR